MGPRSWPPGARTSCRTTALFLLSSLPVPRTAPILSFGFHYERGEGGGGNDVRDDDLHLTRRSIPLATIILRCVLPGSFFSAASNARDAFLCTSYTLRRVRLHRAAIMNISNVLRLTRDRMRRYRQSNCPETTDCQTRRWPLSPCKFCPMLLYKLGVCI